MAGRGGASCAGANGRQGPEAPAAPYGDGVPAAAIGSADAVIQARLAELQAGWSDEQAQAWVYQDFLGPLADGKDLPEPRLFLYLDWLVARLKQQGYKPKTRSQYHQLWKEMALAKLTAAHADAASAPAGGLECRICVRPWTLDGAHDPKFLDPLTGQRLPDAPPVGAFQTEGYFDPDTLKFLTNFTVRITEEIEFRDETEQRRRFRGLVKCFGTEGPFEIDARDYADNNKLKAVLQEAAGVSAVIYGKVERLREAVSTLNWRPGQQQPVSRAVTPNFGWNADGTAFQVPGGRVTSTGFVAADDQTPEHIELNEELACHLDVGPVPAAADLKRCKEHIVQDLLRLQPPCVAYSLLGAVGVAALGHFAPDHAPFALWLVGVTGAGKSFAAKLFANFFGDFPVASGRFASWAATVNYLQRVGHAFKDALYLIDDYKPEIARHDQVVRLLQNYADRQGRGRLKIDATTNTTRPIRGLLVCTGEDVPEHTGSALARSIVIEVPQQPKNLARGARCVAMSRHYRRVTADLIRHLLARCRTATFAKLVRALQRRFYRGIAGQQNDSRIAGNFALLAAGLIEVAAYLGDAWPGWQAEVRRFLDEDLEEILQDMVGGAQGQQPAEIFWSVLGSLLELGSVVLYDRHEASGKPVVGKRLWPTDGAVPGVDLVYISTDLAMAEVNRSLRAQARPELKVSAAALVGQLRRAGRLFGMDGQPLTPDGDGKATRQLRIANRGRRGFITSRTLLVPEA